MTNNLHRSTSDPNLTNSLTTDSSSVTVRPIGHSNTNSLTYPHQSQLNRLHSSASTSSLFGPPHHLGTLTDSHHNVINNSNTNNSSLPVNNSPDTQIKQQSFTTDDSAPDITQLALSCHRFSLNVNSVDNILRTMSRPRKHTTSTSSTTSSLSEAWSLTKINLCDQHQPQRMVC